MKKTFLTTLLGAMTLALGAHATIIVGEPGYIGDFEGASLTVNQAIRITEEDLGSGWATSGSSTQWQLLDDGSGLNTVAHRSEQNQFAGFSIGITFDGSSLANQDAQLTFDYAQVSAADNGGQAGFLVIGSNYGTLSNGNTYGISNVNSTPPGLDGVNAVVLYDGTFDGPNALGTSGSVSATFNMGSYAQYTFVFSSNASGGAATVSSSFIDNVALTAIPEPSTYAAIAAVCALGLVMMRRRRK